MLERFFPNTAGVDRIAFGEISITQTIVNQSDLAIRGLGRIQKRHRFFVFIVIEQEACQAHAGHGLVFGTIGFTGSFVAQYSGAGATERVGTAVWQGIFLSLIGGAILATGYFWAEPLFALFRHEPEVTAQEIRYFKILSLGNVLLLLNAALGAFWSGRGKTVMVMSVSFLITLMNVPFNYALIYGNWGAPELGIAGAAWGTNLSALVGCIVYACFFFIPRSSRRHFNTCSNIIDWGLLWRLIRFGVPNGFQFFVDLSAFNIFVIVVGTYGKDIGAATAIAFGLNSIAFTPILGIGQTVAILVGQSIGANDVHRAKKSVKSARNLTLIYMGLMAVFFVLRLLLQTKLLP